MYLQIVVVDGLYLVIRVFLGHTGLDVTYEGVDEAVAFSHRMPLPVLAAAQVPAHIIQPFIKFCLEALTCLEHNILQILQYLAQLHPVIKLDYSDQSCGELKFPKHIFPV